MSSIKGKSTVKLTVAHGVYSEASEEIVARVKVAMAANPKLSHSQATMAVLRDDPALALRYRDQFSAREHNKDTEALKLQQDADAFVTEEVRKLQINRGWDFGRALAAVKKLHPIEFAAYAERNS